MAACGSSLIQPAGTAIDSAATAGLAISRAPPVRMLTKEFPNDAKDVLLDFLAALLVPAGLTRDSHLLPAGERGARGRFPWFL